MTDIELQAKNDRELLLMCAGGVNGINDRLDRMNGSIADHEKRLRSVERWRYGLVGGMALCIVLIPVLVTLTVQAFGK